VPGGGLSPPDRAPSGFFLPVAVLCRLFRRLFLEGLQRAFDTSELRFLSSLERLHDPVAFRRYLNLARQINWVVYAKPPFAGAERVLEYVGRWAARSGNRRLSLEMLDRGYGDFCTGRFMQTLEYRKDVFPEQPPAGPFFANLGGFLLGLILGFPKIQPGPQSPQDWCKGTVICLLDGVRSKLSGSGSGASLGGCRLLRENPAQGSSPSDAVSISVGFDPPNGTLASAVPMETTYLVVC
jgi:hypothetical protein